MTSITPRQPAGWGRDKKIWQANYIAPLQPPTLAAFRPWEVSAGAGRVRPAAAKIIINAQRKLMVCGHIITIDRDCANQFVTPVTE